MPEISRFYGIVITMYYGDHAPPHFHARYGSARAAVDIRTLQVIAGALPPRVLGLVVEWGARRRTELMDDWDKAQSASPLDRIAPLE